MVIENLQTTKQYTVTKEGWESLGAKRQKAFKVVNFQDSPKEKSQIVGNNAGKKTLSLSQSKDDASKKENPNSKTKQTKNK